MIKDIALNMRPIRLSKIVVGCMSIFLALIYISPLEYVISPVQAQDPANGGAKDEADAVAAPRRSIIRF